MICEHKKWVVVLLLSLFSTAVFADAMQQRRVTIAASIFPRIIAVDLELTKKRDEKGNVRLGLIYSSDENDVKKIAKLMTKKIKNISGNPIVLDYINIVDADLSIIERLSGIFLVHDISDADLKKVQQYATKNRIIVFSPFEGDVERGVLAGIFIGAKIRPYLNLRRIKETGIRLKPGILRVSKTYE